MPQKTALPKTSSKFAPRNLLGVPRDYFFVEESSVSLQSAKKEPTVSDLVLMLDMSGSMTYDRDDVVNTTLKVLAITEFNRANVKVTVISWSSKGDVVMHARRVPIVEFMDGKSAARKDVERMQTRGLTCMSQGLRLGAEVAREAVKQGGIAAMVLMSDGWVNDRSPAEEKREIASLIEGLRSESQIFCNTIAFRESSDFSLLASIANQLSGTCIQAKDIQQVYGAIYDTTKLVAGKVAPAISIPLAPGAVYQVAVVSGGEKVLGAAGEIVLRGVEPSDRVTLYTFQKASKSAWEKSKVPESTPAVHYARALAMIAEGRLNEAKYAVVSSRNLTLLEEHARALVSEEIAEFASSLRTCLFVGTPPNHFFGKVYGVPDAKKMSVLEICDLLGEHIGEFDVNLWSLLAGYRRRGIKKIPGVRLEDGTIAPPAFRTEARDPGPYVRATSFRVNQSDATINMKVAYPVRLLRADGIEVIDVAGIRLDKLSDFREFTIVGDGQLSVSELCIRVSDKRLWRALAEVNLVKGDFQPGVDVAIHLDRRPLISYATAFDAQAVSDIPRSLAEYDCLTSLLGALLKESSVSYAPSQIEALKAHCLTANLYTQIPSVTPFTSEADAAAKGLVDYRTTYTVSLGTPGALSKKAYGSANQFLKRWYKCEGVRDPKSPKLLEWWDPAFRTLDKDRSKLKSGEPEVLLASLFGDFFSGGKSKVIKAIATRAGILAKDFAKVEKVMARKIDGDEAIEVVTDFKKQIEAASRALYAKELAPLVFYIGSTGLIPDDFGDVRAMTADEFQKAYPEADLGKDESGATFYVVGNVVISIFAETAAYSTAEGVKAAKELEKSIVRAAA